MAHPALTGRSRNSKFARGRSRNTVGGDSWLAAYDRDVVPWSSWDTDGSATPTRVNSSTALSMGYQSQSAATADDGDYIEWNVALAAGTYTFTVIHVKTTNCAIAAFTLDGTSMGATLDLYAASPTFNNVASRTGITVASPGNHVLRMTATGKNASSTDYAMSTQWFTFTRTGA